MTTNEEGRYALLPQEDSSWILLVHPEAGYRVARWGELRAAPDVPLQAWGQLEVATTAREGSEARYLVRSASRHEDGNARIHFESTPVLSPAG